MIIMIPSIHLDPILSFEEHRINEWFKNHLYLYNQVWLGVEPRDSDADAR